MQWRGAPSVDRKSGGTGRQFATSKLQNSRTPRRHFPRDIRLVIVARRIKKKKSVCPLFLKREIFAALNPTSCHLSRVLLSVAIFASRRFSCLRQIAKSQVFAREARKRESRYELENLPRLNGSFLERRFKDPNWRPRALQNGGRSGEFSRRSRRSIDESMLIEAGSSVHANERPAPFVRAV